MNEKLLIAMIANIEGQPTPEEWALMQNHAKKLTAQNVAKMIRTKPDRIMRGSTIYGAISGRSSNTFIIDDPIGMR